MQQSQAVHQLKIMLHVLAEAEAGIDNDPLPADPRRYLLTVSGHSSLETKAREWESFAKGTEALIQRART